jgi:hypothetical protein
MKFEQYAPVPISVILDKMKFKIESGALSIKDIKSIQHNGLKQYLSTRGIPLDTARKCLKELYIYNKKSKKYFYALGLKNDDDGYFIQNHVFTGYIGDRATTFIRGTNPKPGGIHIFREAMDYMSIVSRAENGRFKYDSIVLNALSCLQQAKAYIQNYGYRISYTWLDNGKNGRAATQDLDSFLKAENVHHRPMNYIYQNFRNANAWHVKNIQ